MNIAKTMSKVMEVGEVATVVRGTIRGICAATFRRVTLRIRRDVWCAHYLGGKNL